MQELNSISNSNEMNFLNHLDETALFKKSARHFLDALYERKIRNDIDCRALLIQTMEKGAFRSATQYSRMASSRPS